MMDRRSLRTGLFAFTASVVTVLAVFAFASPAFALSHRFTVDGGAVYSRDLRVSVGDGGWSPFFRPGVVVWDGGSIVSGHGAGAGYEFPAQTLAVLPRVCTSYVSVSPSARIADMVAAAPAEVDARFSRYADLNLCVLHAGGGDFRRGTSAASVYSQVRTYCRGRRAAGFTVVVMTVLPTDRPATFEVARIAYNTMLRDGWAEFADGLADVAADPRIGDDGDQMDEQFYRSDGVHLTNVGNSVMAAVTAPVLNGQPWVSSRCEMRVRDAMGAWKPWRPYSARRTLQLEDYQGVHLVEAEYRLDGGTVLAASDEIFVDTVRPRPGARTMAIRRGRTAVLRYRVDDARPCGPTTTVVATVKTTSGRTLKTFVRRRVPVGRDASVVFKCRLPKGSYRWVVTARDTAGNPQQTPATARLLVR